MRILVTGADGFIGQHVIAALLRDQLTTGHVLIATGRRDHDLSVRRGAWMLLQTHRPDVVIHLACPTPGGIGAMAATPTLCADMARIDANVIEACADFGVQQVIATGSVCSFPERAPIPATELDLFNGPPEATNAPYGEAKRFLWTLLEAFRKERGLQSTYLVLSNVYGPGDTSQHVIPATIRKLLAAQAAGVDAITAWGDGTATRDLLYIDDAVAGILAAIGKPHDQPILLCRGAETSVAEIVTMLSTITEFAGAVEWDTSQPVGQQRRAFRSLGKGLLGPLYSSGTYDALWRTVQWWKETQCSR